MFDFEQRATTRTREKSADIAHHLEDVDKYNARTERNRTRVPWFTSFCRAMTRLRDRWRSYHK
jgi:hypothetical protein